MLRSPSEGLPACPIQSEINRGRVKSIKQTSKYAGTGESYKTGSHDRRIEFNGSEYFILDLQRIEDIHCNSFANDLDHGDKKMSLCLHGTTKFPGFKQSQQRIEKGSTVTISSCVPIMLFTLLKVWSRSGVGETADDPASFKFDAGKLFFFF